jgi:hypothetical protein
MLKSRNEILPNLFKIKKLISTKSLFILITTLLFLFNSIISENLSSDKNRNTTIIKDNENQNIKNILVIIFPGGKSHHFVMKKLFDFVINNKNKSNFIYKFHILVHNYDKDFWENAPKSYKIYGYGDQDKFDVIFNQALEKVKKDPIFGYDYFSKAMTHIATEFAESEIINELKKIKYDMLISDIPNCIFKILKETLDIKVSLYLSPPNLPNLFYGIFEINPVTLPALGSPFTDKLTFWQRMQNFVFIYGFQIMGLKFMNEQMNVFRQKGYIIDTSNYFDYESLIMIQYPIGFAFNISRPPNMIFLNYITPTDAQSLEKEDIDLHNFLNIHKKNVYISQGTIFKNIDFNKVIKVFEELPEVGFVLSIKKEVSILYKFPKNVLLKNWVNQNNLLGDKRIHAFVSHGGINSIVEAIYHKKPSIAIGVAIDQVNTAAMVKTREIGISFFSQKDVNSENITPAIKSLLEDGNKYIKNTEKMSDILKMNKPATEEFSYWLEYGLIFGFDHLIVNAYSYYESYQFFNIDVIFCFILIIFLILWFIKKFLFSFFSFIWKKVNKDIILKSKTD